MGNRNGVSCNASPDTVPGSNTIIWRVQGKGDAAITTTSPGATSINANNPSVAGDIVADLGLEKHTALCWQAVGV